MSTQCENNLVQKANNVKGTSPFSTFWKDHVDTMQGTHRIHSTISSKRNLMDYVKNGACVGIFAQFDALRFHADKNTKYLKSGIDARIGSATVSADAKCLLFKNGKIDPSLALEASANASLANVGAHVNIGNSYVAASGEGNVQVGCIKGEAKAVLSKDEISFKANANASAIHGEVKGTLSILGVKISATASGDIGSIGLGAEFSSKKGEFEVGTNASLFAGLGFKIRVNY